MASPEEFNRVKVVFSDLDGTLVHYPREFAEYASVVSEDEARQRAVIRYDVTGEERECVILPSLTGGKSYMSLATVKLIERLRDMGVIFVIITGARTSTYIQRRSLLPAADYEFFENGGRKLANGVPDPDWTENFTAEIGPVEDKDQLVPKILQHPDERKGSLWELYAKMTAEGWSTDARNYLTLFRVNVAKTEGKTVDDFARYTDSELSSRNLAKAFNLGKADIYPAGSGKANAAAHILAKHGLDASDAVAMFDDDNDLELGALVGKSFLPGITHKSVYDAMTLYGKKWTVTASRGFLGTEEALHAIIEMRRRSLAAEAAAVS